MIRRPFSIDKIVVLVFIVVALIAGVRFRTTVPNCGLVEITRIHDIKTGTVTIDYALGDDWFAQGELEKEVKKLDSAPIIVVATATGNIKQTEASYGQEIVVKKVIRGENMISCDQKYYIFQYFGFRERDGEIVFMNTLLNAMDTTSDYLIFLEETPLNQYQKAEIYILYSEFLGYIRIGEQFTETMQEDYKKYDFLELRDNEFFSVSEDTTRELNEARKEVLHKYVID